MENKKDIQEFIDLIQVDKWEISNKSLNNEILAANLYKNEKKIGEMKFFDGNIIEFKLKRAAFTLEIESNIVDAVLNAYGMD